MSILDKANKKTTLKIEDFINLERIHIQPHGISKAWTKWEEPKFIFVPDYNSRSDVNHYQIAEWMYNRFQEIGFSFLLDPNKFINVMNEEFGMLTKKGKQWELRIQERSRRLRYWFDNGRSAGLCLEFDLKASDISLFNPGKYIVDHAFNIAKIE